LLKKETLSLPDIVDTLGDRPYAVKASITEYLTELRSRSDKVDEVRDEEEKKAADLLKDAVAGTKFDADAEEPESDDEEGKSEKKSTDAAKADSSSEDAAEKKSEEKNGEEDAASKSTEDETKTKDDKDKKE